MNILVYTPTEVAEILKVKASTVRRWLREGSLRGIRISRVWRIKKDALERLLQYKEKEKE